VRVIRCPNCDEPLPGFANFCAACGETLPPAPTSTTIKVSDRPRALKVPHFFSLENDDDASAALLSSETVKFVRRSPRSSLNSSIPVAEASIDLADIDLAESTEDESSDGSETRYKKNWHKIVDTRPVRTPSLPRIPVSAPRTPAPLPLPSEYLLTQKIRRKPRHTPPALFFWLSMLLLAAIVGGGLFGVVMTLGRGILRQSPPHHDEIALQVMPSSVVLGAIITVRGTNFSPRVHVGLTRDSAIPIVDTANNTIIQADSKGTFTDTVIVDPVWQAGSHIIRAEDARLHTIAAFTILVTGHSPSLRPAHLLLSMNSLDLGDGDQATNSTKTITLTNAGGGQISWQTATTQPWLLLTPRNGTFSSGQSIQVMLAADRSNLQPGPYSAQAIFTSNAGKVALPVKMKTTLLEPGHEPVLQLTPALLSFTGTDGGIGPPAQVVTVSNPGVLPLQWGASTSDGSGWLSVSPSSGNVTKGGSQAVVIGVNTSAQLPGVYSGVITFSSQGPESVKDSPQNVYVSLTISPQCALEASPGNLAFTGVYLQPSPAAKIISLNVTQSCTIPLRWSAAATTNNGGHWLNISPAAGTTPSYPSISVNTADLAPGVYGGSIFFSSTTGTQTLPVTFFLGQSTTPILATAPATIGFSGIIGQPQPAGHTITIMNTGGGNLNWQATAATNFGGAWLAVSSTAGGLTSSHSVSVNVTATVLPGLTPNTYTGMVTITGTNSAGHSAIGSPQSIPVNFTVLPPCTIAAAPPALSFAGVAGQSNPAAKVATISAAGTCTHPLNWQATPSAAWITTTPASGSVSLSASSTTSIGVSLSGLAANSYSGRVTITAVDSVTQQSVGTPQTITVTLSLQPPCTLQAPSPAGETFNSEAGTNPATQTFTIGIFGACTGNVSITPTVTQSWLSLTPLSATISGGSATFTVTVTSASLGAGKYSDSISLAAVDGGITITGSPQAVSVALNVLATPSLAVGPGSLTFNVTTGTTSQPIGIDNTGGMPLNWSAALASGAPSFVSLSATSGTNLAGGASTSVSVIVDASGVSGGSTFTTGVTIDAIDPLTGNAVSGSPVTVTVTINIAAPAMQLSAVALNYTITANVNPAAQSITISNTGGGGLTWQAGAPSQAWLTLGLTSGDVTSQTSSPVSFNVNAAGLISGTTYTATVVITPSVGSAQMVTVTVTVS
jgi:hypothetical protein